MANLLKRNIPNLLTCCNLVSGCIATTYALYTDIQLALVWMVVGAVFDFFDGMSARLLHVSSPIGKELDSLADDITSDLPRRPSFLPSFSCSIIPLFYLQCRH